MFKSSRRNTAEGMLDHLAGRLLDAFGAVTGRRTTKAKGKAARAQGSARDRTGRAKRTAR